MSGTSAGATKQAAARAGLTPDAYRARIDAGEKWCWRCAAWHPTDAFGLDRSRDDGRAAQCLASRRTPKRPPKTREERRADYRRWYREQGAPAVRARVHARKRGVAPIPLTAQRMILAEFDGLCAYCDRRATTWDHVIPVSQGGRTSPGNVVPACGPCNASKRSHDIWEWCARKGIVPRDAFFERVVLLYEHGG
jgi:5-methylcytosine-specific restriction endonuclease McrA